MNPDIRSKTSTIDIYVKLAQFPILADQIRRRMREELYTRGVITEETFEEEVEREAIASQKREGLYDPFGQEVATIWEERKTRIRNFNTDYWFAYNLPLTLFDQIVRDTIESQHDSADLLLSFNPEIAPWEMLFRQGEAYENMPPNEQETVMHHLEEIKVVLIRGMISDQLPLIGVAKKVLSIGDLRQIYAKRIGRGKIGGKAAGMIIAWKILKQKATEIGPDISQGVQIPTSYYLATDVMYDFRSANNLDYIMNQKYRPLAEVRADYENVIAEHLAGEFPEKVENQLANILERCGSKPLIVRSSSLLEDNFGTAFAGKYHSYFCPNQATPNENLAALLEAIKRIYASTLNPDAILYRQKHGLIDYDERMAVLIQEVSGEKLGDYYFPTLAGVAFSQNPFRWHPKIRREDGFLRLVWGMGTRAVDRVARDYPRLIALSHPTLRPETTAKAIRRYSQRYIDLIDLKANEFKTLPVDEVFDLSYAHMRYLFSAESDGTIQKLLSTVDVEDTSELVLTFDYLAQDRRFVKLMRTALTRLEHFYETPVDVEFTVEITPSYPRPEYKLHVLQCRPLSQRADNHDIELPTDIDDEQTLFTEHQLVPHGAATGIRYIVYVDPKKYDQIADVNVRYALGHAISRLNQQLRKERFILMGPGRWGSTNIELGVRVSYADIHNTKVLIEMAIAKEDSVPELSYGTHFFQDLVEAGIYSLALHLDQPKSRFDWAFFEEAENLLAHFSPADAELSDYLRVIDVAQHAPQRRLNIVMNAELDRAVGYFEEREGVDSAENQDDQLIPPY